MNENPTNDGADTEAPHAGQQAGPQPGPQPGSSHEGPRVSGEQMRDLANLRRSSYDRHVAGVAGGLGRHLDVDPVILRVAFVVLTFFGGAGLIIYVACWLLVPEDTGRSATIQLDARSRNVALIGVGILAGLALVGDAWGPGWFPWPLFAIGLIAWVILSRRDRRERRRNERTYGPNAGWVGPGTQTGWSGTGAQPGWVGADATATMPLTGGLTDGPTGGATGGPMAPPPPPRLPRNPRKRGPILFWFTLALTALASGVLGIFDLAGADVTDSAYPALALGVIGVMLVVGAFYGRAGGLIFLGLVAAVVLSLSTIADRWDGTTVKESPTSASQLKSSYDMEAGEIRLDLTQVRDLRVLDGRTLEIDGEVGTIEVIVPRGLHVSADATVEIGEIEVFGRSTGGLDLDLSGSNLGDADQPHLRIDADLEVGDVSVVAR
ncbi:PspC domain-containing protein [Nocardioides sp. Root140]|uniref:PspC domain-containing protein n=1 Tax=Nocardioides sp. Root140 TaxID=1736460 RepID=UPI0006F72C85|nr:PspC domain-containing protein [Nocardioides sp. Root140]KQY56532.1 hypothetical protein ASD30_09365 [Nocardioides sp. Root140]